MVSFNVKSVIAGLALGAVSIAAQPAAAESIELKVGDFQSTTHIVSKEGTVKWMNRVEELTDGKVSFTHFPAAQAAPARGLLDAAKKGVVLDVSLIGALYHSDRLPLHSVVGLPGFYRSSAHGTAALQEMMADGPLREELLAQGVVPIFSFVLPPYQLLMKDQRVGGKSDWEGLNIRTSGSTQALTARALGAAAVSIPGPDVYSALERGRVDGVLFPLPSVPAYNLQEVSNYITTNGSFGGYSFVLVVRKEVYDDLPGDVQDAMLKAGREAAMNVARAQDDSIEGFLSEWQEQGIETYAFTDSELKSINDAISEVAASWAERVGEQSPKADAVLEQYRQAVAQ